MSDYYTRSAPDGAGAGLDETSQAVSLVAALQKRPLCAGVKRKFMSSGIDHLIINKPYDEPDSYWQYDAMSMSFKLAKGRRPAGYMVASSNKKIINDPGKFIPLPFVQDKKGL